MSRDPTRRTITVEEAGRILGLSRATAYQAAAHGDIPVLRIGRRLLVPVSRLKEMLGERETVGGGERR